MCNEAPVDLVVLAVGDLYGSIAEKVKDDVKVQCWGVKKQRDASYRHPHGKVMNITSVNTDFGGWTPSDDHSKWCVAGTKPWTCIADVNRTESQYKRRGGALCMEDPEIHEIFKSFVGGVEEP